MSFIDGVFHSDSPKGLSDDRFTLTEVDQLIPGIMGRVFLLMSLSSYDDFSTMQKSILDDMQKEGLRPKDVYVSLQESASIPQLKYDIDLSTFMMTKGLASPNTFGSNLSWTF